MNVNIPTGCSCGVAYLDRLGFGGPGDLITAGTIKHGVEGVYFCWNAATSKYPITSIPSAMIDVSYATTRIAIRRVSSVSDDDSLTRRWIARNSSDGCFWIYKLLEPVSSLISGYSARKNDVLGVNWERLEKEGKR